MDANVNLERFKASIVASGNEQSIRSQQRHGFFHSRGFGDS